MSEKDLIAYFIHLIEDLGFTVVYADMEIAASVIPSRNLVLLSKKNVNIFVVAHEYAHIKLEHMGRLTSFNGNDERNSNEYAANVLALQIIIQNHIDMGCAFNSAVIMEWYEVPSHLENLVIDIMSEMGTYFEYGLN